MRTPIDKLSLVRALRGALEGALEAAKVAHADAMIGATHAEARPENDKDTRGLEQSYLARGQAQRVAELEEAIAALGVFAPRAFGEGAPIALGALVTVEEEGESRALFVAPHGGGTILEGGVHVVTPVSPLGRALVGKEVGDEVELQLPGRKRTLVVEAVE